MREVICLQATTGECVECTYKCPHAEKHEWSELCRLKCYRKNNVSSCEPK